MSGEEHPDIVDVFYRPFVRLGNLVIAFARAESALLELVSALLGGKEHDAAAIVSRGERSSTLEMDSLTTAHKRPLTISAAAR